MHPVQRKTLMLKSLKLNLVVSKLALLKLNLLVTELYLAMSKSSLLFMVNPLMEDKAK